MSTRTWPRSVCSAEEVRLLKLSHSSETVPGRPAATAIGIAISEGHPGADPGAAAAELQGPWALDESNREADRGLGQGDAGADGDRDHQQLVALADRRRRRQAAVERGPVGEPGGEDRGAGAAEEQGAELRQAVGDDRDEGGEGDDRGAGADAGAGEHEREAGQRQRGGGEHLAGQGPRPGGGPGEQRDRHRGEHADRARVAERVGEAALDLDPGQEGPERVLGEPLGMQAAEDGERDDEADRGCYTGEQVAAAVIGGGEDAEHEEAEVGDDAGELGGGALVAPGPDEREPCPDGEGAEQADQRDRGARAGRKRHHSEGDADQHDPPDGDADLAADDRVEATLLQHQVGDQREAEQPGGERGRVEAGGHLA